MKRSLVVPALLLLAAVAGAAEKEPVPVTVSSRILADGSRSLMVHIQRLSAPADEVRIELPDKTSQTAVLMLGPQNWRMEPDGGAVRIQGPSSPAPMRLRMTLFDVKELKEAKIRVRSRGKDILNKGYPAALLPPLQAAGTTSGLLHLPVIVRPGETVDATVLDASRTPTDGTWVIAGTVVRPEAPGRLSVRLPDDLQPGSPVRVSFFDAWGERIVDALSTEETVVTEPAAVPARPQITGCAASSFIGQSLCVCGNFPPAARSALRIDGRPALALSASQGVIHLLLPSTLAPGAHTITGDPAAGFTAGDMASMLALRLQGVLDRNKLKKGQSTDLKIDILGTTQPLTLAVTNKTPGVVSIPGGNYQEIITSGGATNRVERRVNATGIGDFTIDYRLDVPTCPCQEQTRGDYPSTASRPAPVIVPRRVLATVNAGTPSAMLATAQALALANGLSVVEVFPLVSVNAGLVVFEIEDGGTAAAKTAALAADPRVALSQPDFVYDTSQAKTSPAQAPTYGLQMIGADLAQGASKGEGIRVAVIDAGIDTGHAALTKKVAEYADVTRTGWTPDAHGTLVAGVIAGEPSKAAGTAGVAPGVQIVAVKSCVAESQRLANARCWSSTLARGIDLAEQKNVRVMNLSVGGPEDKLLARLVDSAVQKGIIVVSAVGNDGPSGKPSYPAAFDNVIAMTAVDAATHLYPRATHGAFIDLSAPGVDVLSTGPGGRTQFFSGTSAATAFGSGAVALLLRQNPKLDQATINFILRNSAKDLGPTGPDAEFGYGLLDVCKALLQVSPGKLTCR